MKTWTKEELDAAPNGTKVYISVGHKECMKLLDDALWAAGECLLGSKAPCVCGIETGYHTAYKKDPAGVVRYYEKFMKMREDDIAKYSAILERAKKAVGPT